MQEIKLLVLIGSLTFTAIQVAGQNEGGGFAPVKVYKNELKEDGSYNFKFVLADGMDREESGYPLPDGSYYMTGYFSFITPDGRKEYVNYYADKTGYHPMAEVPPPKIHNIYQSQPGVKKLVGSLPPVVVGTLLGSG